MTLVANGGKRYAALMVAASVALATAGGRASADAPDVEALLQAGEYQQAEAVARGALERLRASTSGARPPMWRQHRTFSSALWFSTGAAPLPRPSRLPARRSTRKKAISDLPTLRSSHLCSTLRTCGVAAGEFGAAIAAAWRAVALCEAKANADRGALGETLDRLGSALSAARRYEEALKALGTGLRLKEHVLHGRDVEIAERSNISAWCCSGKGITSRRACELRRAAAIREPLHSNHPAYVTTLILLAQQLWFEGNLIESKRHVRTVGCARGAHPAPDHPTLALHCDTLPGPWGFR